MCGSPAPPAVPSREVRQSDRERVYPLMVDFPLMREESGSLLEVLVILLRLVEQSTVPVWMLPGLIAQALKYILRLPIDLNRKNCAVLDAKTVRGVRQLLEGCQIYDAESLALDVVVEVRRPRLLLLEDALPLAIVDLDRSPLQ